MFPKLFKGVFEGSHQPEYQALEERETEASEELERNPSQRATCGARTYLLVTTVLFLSLGTLVYWAKSGHRESPREASLCREPIIRREWRSLTEGERSDFTRAVNCLGATPSRWALNGTVYDDFTSLHAKMGRSSHQSAAFLPWHRYTLIVWETALREHCGFRGNVPYWDWTLDWMDLGKSSIWDNMTGFGGDGEAGGPLGVGGGRCVTDGPFTQLRPIWFNHSYVPHCISRSFNDNDTVGRLRSEDFSPEWIGAIKRSRTYNKFMRHIELHLHNVMHHSIGGDFMVRTAANDPVFYLHHAQIDHLWWQWQQEDRTKRLYEYTGKQTKNATTDDASLDRLLSYGGFVDDIPVRQVMDTEGGFLCYRY